MTAAIHAVYLQLTRHLLDLKAREKIQQNAVLRANKRLGCNCLPSSSWTFEPMGLREVHAFAPTQQHSHDRDEDLINTNLCYLGALQQSRIFAHLEVFELGLPATVETPARVSLSELPALQRRYGPGVAAVVVDSSDLWDIRRQCLAAFLDAARRAVDIVRLSVLTGPTQAAPGDGLWEPQGIREFSAAPGIWVSGMVYEANSAQLDKARRWLGRANRA